MNLARSVTIPIGPSIIDPTEQAQMYVGGIGALAKLPWHVAIARWIIIRFVKRLGIAVYGPY